MQPQMQGGDDLNSFEVWSSAKNAFAKWSLLVVQRFAELRGLTLPVK